MDLSAGLVGTQSEHFKKFCEKVTELKEYIGSHIQDLYQKKMLDEQINEILAIHKSPSMIPLVMAPPERDWQIPLTNNYVLLQGIDADSKEKKYRMIVTAEIHTSLRNWVNIRKSDDKSKLLEFSQPAK